MNLFACLIVAFENSLSPFESPKLCFLFDERFFCEVSISLGSVIFFNLLNMIKGVTKSGITFCQKRGSSTSTLAVAAEFLPLNFDFFTIFLFFNQAAVCAPSTTRVRVRFAKIESISSSQKTFASSSSPSRNAYAPFLSSSSISFASGLSSSLSCPKVPKTARSRPSFLEARLNISCSNVFAVTKRYIITSFVCPILWHLACAWTSFCGFQSLSKIMQMSAAVRLIPTPPARVLSKKTKSSGSDSNLSIAFCLSLPRTLPSKRSCLNPRKSKKSEMRSSIRTI
mmetsp:Transcript_17910/g.35727  ORF Transcript_17910/g.35727 Transcript_17910/m.35727 type:complete len:283 (-) Transcript_17910:3660-4508(-)